ncbi:nitrate reductase associated protein [Cyanobacterium aponinum FACHB-4101]|uniref:nitrate reductase associated protein n=1 Tax=Cyanobacterium aponinum TaxID=379064 RepID=UPI001681448D|nr:nitrate reductase associated protein [Cyanobacterium aponinum]MBD2393995.1 nitrate reductase associated protein [Cyanobacterium aponinum FACHB-4101]
MTIFFKFEQDFVNSLRCIPMIVRYKLDTCGVKLKLNHWHEFNKEEKDFLVHKPCKTTQEIKEYADYLQELVREKTGEYAKSLEIESNPQWSNIEEIPEQVSKKAEEFNFQLTLSQWQNLDNLQRFVLIKLSKSGHENRNFLPALKEFKLIN